MLFVLYYTVQLYDISVRQSATSNANNEQLLNKVGHDIKNYHLRSLPSSTKAEG